MDDRTATQTQAMRDFQEGARRRVVESIHKALEDLEAEVAAHGGEFPSRKLTRKALCAKAGVGESTLKNPTHAETRKLVDERLDEIRTRGQVRPVAKRQDSTAVAEGLPPSKAIKAMAMQLDLAHRRICELEAEGRTRALRIQQLEEDLRADRKARAA